MATVSQAVSVLSKHLGEDESFTKQVARRLMDDEVLPKSRGRAVPEISTFNLAELMIATLVSEKVNQSTKLSGEYLTLTLRGAQFETVDEVTVNSLGLFFANALDDIHEKGFVEGVFDPISDEEIKIPHRLFDIEIVTSDPVVFVRSLVDPLTKKQAFEGDFIFAKNKKMAAYPESKKPRRSITINGECLMAIMSALQACDILNNRNVNPSVERHF